MKGKKHISAAKAAICYILCAALVIGLIVGNYYALKYQNLISVYFNQSNQKIISSEGETSDYYTSDFTTEDERVKHLREIGTQIEGEGIVLLKDDNNVLPLTKGSKISVFGQDSVDPVYGGGGAGSVDSSKAVSLKMAFEKSEFDINKTLWDFYEKGEGSSYRKQTPDVYGEGSFVVNEVPTAVYTDNVKQSFANYNDAAVVVIGRSGGESSDLSTVPLESGYNYLQLDDNEKAMLQMASDNFDKVIVLLNTQNAMELNFLGDYDIDACLWIGALGETGAYAVADVLNGSVNPSGALTDTYAYNSLSAPSMANFGNYTISNSEVDRGNTYMVYGEGIYVGYLYYETRYEDVVLGNEDKANYNYVNEVQFPFGYGLSYTDFKWSDYSVKETDDTFEVSVTVTNTGEIAGKDIVQVYMQSPYTDYNKTKDIEKASVKLAGFAKTSTIEAGQMETVTVSVDKETMKTYDAKGYKTYIVDAGDYYFAAGNDAHDALNNILAAKDKTVADGMDYDGNADFTTKVTVDKLDAKTYAVSQDTGNDITNQFDETDMNYYDPNFTYLSRSNWTGTWPITYAEGTLTASDEMLKDLEISFTEDENAIEPTTEALNDELGKLNAATLIGADYTDIIWNHLIEQMSVEELDKLVRIGGYATSNIKSIQLPATVDKDGPAGISGTLVGGESGTSYPPAVVLASTWNTDLAREFGRCIGEDSLALKVAVWYAPACNIHRSPYSGRNFEYYSEDGYLSGEMTAKTVIGAQSKGAVVTVKHFALNDQETNRVGGAIYANEQSIREIYLQPFEASVREVMLILLFFSAFLCQDIFLNGTTDYSQVNYQGATSDFFNCTLVLVVQYSIFRISTLNKEKEIVKQILHERQKQYNLSKENIDMINHKCHDLKHQIQALKEARGEDLDMYIDEVENSIMIYDTVLKTENEVLNTILSEKSLYCEKHRIRLSCIIDANQLDFMSILDIYALLGNALDNAIESVSKHQDTEKRVISFTISANGGFLCIQTNNYYEGNLSIVDGLPVTTKNNLTYHGFGIKSMKHLTEKYGGTLYTNLDNEIFMLQIVIPIPTEFTRLLNESKADKLMVQ